MRIFDYKIRIPVGIHVRNAILLSQVASKFSCDISVCKGNQVADARKLMDIMILRVKCGDEIQFVIEGEEEEEAYQRIKELCEWNF